MPVFGYASNPLHLYRIQHQHHEDVVWEFPLAANSIGPGWSEPEARIVLWVPDYHDEWATRLPEFPIAGLNELASNALTLMFRHHGHRSQSVALIVAHGE